MPKTLRVREFRIQHGRWGVGRGASAFLGINEAATLDPVLAPAFLVARREVDDVLGLSAHKSKQPQIESRLRQL